MTTTPRDYDTALTRGGLITSMANWDSESRHMHSEGNRLNGILGSHECYMIWTDEKKPQLVCIHCGMTEEEKGIADDNWPIALTAHFKKVDLTSGY